MNNELKRLRKITETLTSNGYLIDQTKEWEYAFDAVPDYIFVVNRFFEVKFINRAMAERLGVEDKEDVNGMRCYEMLGFSKPMLPACDIEEVDEVICDGCVNTGECLEKDGDVCDYGAHPIPRLEGVFQFTRSAIRSSTKKLLGYICVLKDVTETRMVDKSSQALLKLHTLDCDDDERLARFILEQIVDLTDSEVGYLHFVDDDGIEAIKLDLFIWSKDVSKNCQVSPQKHYPLEKAGIWADCVRQRKAVIHNDYPNTEGLKGLPDGHFPIKRHMSVPIFDDAKIVAVAGVGNKLLPYTDIDVTQTSITLSNMWTIMKRKKAERELAATEQSYKEITTLTKTGVYEIDFLTDRFLYVNGVMSEQTGYTKEELMGMGPSSILTEDSQIKWLERFERFNQGEKIPNTVEYQARRKDGSIMWVLCTADYKLSDEGNIIGARVVAIDITEQKSAEEKVKDVLDSCPFGVHLYEYRNEKLVFKGANPAADKILGVDNKIYEGLELEEAFPALAESDLPDQYRNVVTSGNTWDSVVEYKNHVVAGAFEVHAFRTSHDTMAAMFREISEERMLRHKVNDLSDKLDSAEKECRTLTDYLITEKKK